MGKVLPLGFCRRYKRFPVLILKAAGTHRTVQCDAINRVVRTTAGTCSAEGRDLRVTLIERCIEVLDYTAVVKLYNGADVA